MTPNERGSLWINVGIFASLLALSLLLPRVWRFGANSSAEQQTASTQNSPANHAPLPKTESGPTFEELTRSLTHIQNTSGKTGDLKAVQAEVAGPIADQPLKSVKADDQAGPSLKLPADSVTEAASEGEMTLLETPAEAAKPAEAAAKSEEETTSPIPERKDQKEAAVPSPAPTESSSDAISASDAASAVSAIKEAAEKTIAKITAKDEPTERLASRPNTNKAPQRSVELEKEAAESAKKPVVPEKAIPPSVSQEKKRTFARRGEKLGNSWLEPTTFLALLEEMSKSPLSSTWAKETAGLVRSFGGALRKDGESAKKVVERLDEMSDEAKRFAGACADRAVARKLRQASFSLDRRLEIWRIAAKLGPTALVEAEMPDLDAGILGENIAKLEEVIGDSPAGKPWREYFLLSEVKKFSAKKTDVEEARQRDTARLLLTRIAETPMSPSQRAFLTTSAVNSYCEELRKWAAEPVTTAEVLRDMERYEQTKSIADANRLAFDIQCLDASSNPIRRELGKTIDLHYRNANVRVTLSEKFLNSMIPPRDVQVEAVNDRVLGVPVNGQSKTSSDVRIRLIPDSQRIRIAMEVTGNIEASTAASAGPATFYNDSESRYVARKIMEIDGSGILLKTSEVDVANETHLRDLETDFDGVPLIGSLVRGIARSQHEQSRAAAQQETRWKVADKARQRIDEESYAQFSGAVNNLNQNVFGPLVGLALDPTMIESQTTEERMVMRLRVAGADQLGSHTPRPQAPADSVASVQLNETMINNAIERLQLQGRKMTLAELLDRVSQRFRRPNLMPLNPEHRDVFVAFAAKDPVVVHCRDGRVIMELSIDELSKDPREWKNFKVRIIYKPEINGRSVELARDGVIQLMSSDMSLGTQIALRGVFSKAFSNKDTIKIMPEKIAKDPRYEGIVVTQCVVDDGWIGIALGPKRQQMHSVSKPAGSAEPRKLLR